MDSLLEIFQHILDPNWIMHHGGLYLVLLILFIETGFFFGFFLPGDPLLFVAGIVISASSEVHYPFANEYYNLILWISLFILATVLGYFLGYFFGKRFGKRLQYRKDTWLFKKKHIEAAHEFYEEKGGFAIAIARFLPIVRTFAPIIGSMAEMEYRKFAFYNIIGAFVWVVSITTAGFLLGDNEWVKANLEWVILGIVVLVTTPVLLKLLFKKSRK